MRPYVIYARKSTESEDRQVLSIQSQVSELERIAAREGATVAEVLTESKSAKAPGRPVFGALLRRIDKGEIGGVLCWKMDRLARNHLDTGQVLQALADRKLERVITSDRTYTPNGNDRFMGTFEFAAATKFIDDLRSNTLRGLRARVEKGWTSSVPPVGYLNDRVHKTIVKDSGRFALVQRLWQLLLSNTVRVAEIHRIANEELGLRSRKLGRAKGGPLSLSAIYKLFANPFYTGMINSPTGPRPGAHLPMVGREEFDRAQEILGRHDRERPKKRTFTYAGLLRCGNCGRILTGEQHKSPKGPPYVYYRCAGGHSSVCRERAIPERILEPQILSQLARLTLPELVMAFLEKRIASTVAAEATRRKVVRDSLAASLEGIRREEENLLSLRLRDFVDDHVFVAKKAAIRDQRLRIEDRLARANAGAAAAGESISQILDFPRRAHAIFPSGTRFQKRAILEGVAAKSMVRDRKVALEFKIPFQQVADARGIRNFARIREWRKKKPPEREAGGYDGSIPQGMLRKELVHPVGSGAPGLLGGDAGVCGRVLQHAFLCRREPSEERLEFLDLAREVHQLPTLLLRLQSQRTHGLVRVRVALRSQENVQGLGQYQIELKVEVAGNGLLVHAQRAKRAVEPFRHGHGVADDFPIRPLRCGVREIALVLGHLVQIYGRHPGDHYLPQTHHVLKIDGVPLLRHGRGADLLGAEILVHLPDLRALQMPQVRGDVRHHPGCRNDG